MKTPKVSIIIPNYNHAQFLKERIESVLNQTYQDFEIKLIEC
jgi:glycosyltransferase involved in cell wall biosynthesis